LGKTAGKMLTILSKSGVRGWFDYELRLAATKLEQREAVRAIPLLTELPHSATLGIESHAAEIASQLDAHRSLLRSLTSGFEYKDRIVFSMVLEEARSIAQMLAAHPRTSAGPEMSDTVRVVLTAFPVPDDSVPWERIIDLKKDENLAYHLEELRLWIRKVVEIGLSPVEVKEGIEYALSQYEAALRLHRIKTGSTALQLLLTIPSAIVEDLSRLRFGKAADRLFSVRLTKAALLETERSAPGKELAYLSQLRGRLAKTVGRPKR